MSATSTTPRRIGFLADTHSATADGSDLPDQVLDAFAGVDLIVHLGDIGRKAAAASLRAHRRRSGLRRHPPPDRAAPRGRGVLQPGQPQHAVPDGPAGVAVLDLTGGSPRVELITISP